MVFASRSNANPQIVAMNSISFHSTDKDSPHLASEIASSLRGLSSATMLFGSYARGDHNVTSDIDVLQVTDQRIKPYRVGKINISPYSAAAIMDMGRRGSLFVLHLKLDGVILADPYKILSRALDFYTPPLNYKWFFSELREAANILDVTQSIYESKWQPLHRSAIYLLRSACFARCAELGIPTFSMENASIILKNPLILKRYLLKDSSRPEFNRFISLVDLIEETLNTEIKNPFGSIEGIMLSYGERHKLLKSLASSLIKPADDSNIYVGDALNIEDIVCPTP